MRSVIVIIGLLLLAALAVQAVVMNSDENQSNYYECINCHYDRQIGYGSHFITSADDCQFCHILNTKKTWHQVITIMENELCVTCHVSQDAMNTESQHQDLFCVECHNPHGSINQYMFKKPVITLCNQVCHTKNQLGISHPIGGNIIDKRTGKEMTCISTCHSLHSPQKDSKLLQFVDDNVCLQCHGELG